MNRHYPEGHNVGLGMLPCRKNCTCTDCTIEKLGKRIAEQEAELARLREIANGEETE